MTKLQPFFFPENSFLQLNSFSLVVYPPTVFYSLFHFMRRMHIWKHLIFCVDDLQLWSLNLCTETTLLYFNRQGVSACVTACVGVTALMPFPSTHTHWDIGLANRVLHRSASPDSSLKCPWQPPNPQLSFPLCSCTFFSLAEPLMDAAIFLCLSPLECSHNHWVL